MVQRQISVSTVVFDGYPIDTAFDDIAASGLALIELAYIKGYMDFSEEDFEDVAIAAMRKRLQVHGLKSVAISAHMDSGNPDATAMLARRIRFTAGIGARFTITNATTVDKRNDLMRALDANIPLAESLGVTIALENPGNGPQNLMVDGRTGAELVRSFNSAALRMNYDTANALTCTEGGTDPASDIDHALDVSSHMHLKDVVRKDGRWNYVAIGAGELNYGVIMKKLKARPDIPLTIELPLRLNRTFHKDPERYADIPARDLVRSAIATSKATCEKAFGS
jgi:sugar phosphate isomerase/epimerase